MSWNPNNRNGFVINVSNKVVIQKRTVYTLLMMFADVGGLKNFIILVLSKPLSWFGEPMMLASIVQKIFIFSTNSKELRPPFHTSISRAKSQISKAIKSLHRITFSNAFLIFNVISFGLCPVKRENQRKAINQG